jgi:hypothetical protein
VSLRDRARKAAQQEAAQKAAQAEADQVKARQELDERKRKAHADLAPQAAEKVREVLGEETNSSDWKLFHYHSSSYRQDGDDYPAIDSFWVEATFEGVTLQYGHHPGELIAVFRRMEYDAAGQLQPDSVTTLGKVDSLADFGRYVDSVKPPPRGRGWRRR